MNRSPLTRRTPLRSGRRPLPAFSRARKAAAPERRAVREAVLARDGYRCAFPHHLVEVECHGVLDVHEVIPRSAWPAGYLEPSNCLTVARSCHEWIGANVSQAAALGVHGYSWQRPA